MGGGIGGEVGCTEHSPEEAVAAAATEPKGRKSNFLRSISRRKSAKASPTGVQEAPDLGKTKSKEKIQRTLSKTPQQSLSQLKSSSSHQGAKEGQADKLVRKKTGGKTLKHKERALSQYPFLAIEQYGGDAGRNLVLCGSNSICVEVLDMVTMSYIMDDNMRKLTHSAVERFFEWLPLFGVYLERYFYVEEDVLMKWLVAQEGPLKGKKMRVSVRILVRGKLQKMFSDLVQMHEQFPRQLPAGERIGRLTKAVHEFASLVIEYFQALLEEVPPLINKHYNKNACIKLHAKSVKHVIEHVGTEDFLVLYTRWMKPKDLREWKTKVLLRTDFKFLAYSSWEKDMDYAHFQIVAGFAEVLEAETAEDVESAAAEQAEFRRHKSAARQHLDESLKYPDPEDYTGDDDEGSFEDFVNLPEEEVTDT